MSYRLFIFLCLLFIGPSAQGGRLDTLLQSLQQFHSLPYPERIRKINDYVDGAKTSWSDICAILKSEAEEMERQQANPHLICVTIVDLANYQVSINEFGKSSNNLVRAREIMKAHDDGSSKWQKTKGKAYRVMSLIYFFELNLPDAIAEIEKGIEIHLAVKDTTELMASYNRLGIYHSESGDSEKAIAYYDKVLELVKFRPNQVRKSRAEWCKVVDLSLLKRYQEAKEFLYSILPGILENQPKNFTLAKSKLARLEIKTNNLAGAERLFDEIMSELEEKHAKDWNTKSVATEGYIELLTAKGQYKEIIPFKDSLLKYKMAVSKQLMDGKNIAAKAKYKKLEDEQKINELQLQQEVDESKFKSTLFTLIGLFLAVLAGLGFWLYRQKQAQKHTYLLSAKEKETQIVREKLLTSITHELRTPLTIILGKLESLEEAELKEGDQESLTVAQRNAKQLVNQINQLLEWNKLEADALQNRPTIGDAEQVVEQILEEMRPLANHKNINWNVGVKEQNYEGKIDFDKFKTIVSNLVGNALKYSPIDAQIKIKLYQENGELVCSVKDSGPGIQEQQLDSIFEWYYRVAAEDNVSTYEGFGIGLALSKELAELMGGTLKVESVFGQGATFMLRLPFENAHLASEAAQQHAQPSVSSPQAASNGKEDALMLIVEDHPDLSEHIASLFRDEFRVIIAQNLEDGKTMAQKEIPDIIISDIMLPDGSGLDLCKELKSQLLTDHIPIIILTARTDKQSRFTGLKNRADAFMTKPFNNKELSLTVTNLLQNRRILHLRYGGKNQAPADPFTQLVEAALANHYKDSSFNVDAFAKTLALSRGQLYKKIRATFDNTPTNLIRNYRLEMAKQLLQQGNLNISQIAYESGFTSPEYFSTVFKDYFKQSPSEFKSITG